MMVGIVIIASGGTNRLMMAQQHKKKVQQCYNVNRIFSIRQHVWIIFFCWFAYIFPSRCGRIGDDDG